VTAAEEADRQKRIAIDTHSLQAGEFEAAYAELPQDPYRDCFSYSRLRLGRLIDGQLPARGDGLRLLDVGCGTGHHLTAMSARGFAVAGVDGSESMLELARRRNADADLRVADVERLPYSDAEFDVTMCVEVLRYLPAPAGCIREMARVLRPGGLCLATATPLLNSNLYWLVNRIGARLGVAGLVPLRQFFMTSGRLKRLFREAGFSEIQVRGVYTGPINWLERLAPPLLTPALKAWQPIDKRVADAPLLREFSNMFLVCARRR
jgi:ubiquinone/menaquinone biosynthesis C-methylase UbiE